MVILDKAIEYYRIGLLKGSELFFPFKSRPFLELRPFE
jgi:hypothetical protein